MHTYIHTCMHTYMHTYLQLRAEITKAVMREESGQAQTQASGGGDPAMRQEIKKPNIIVSSQK